MTDLEMFRSVSEIIPDMFAICDRNDPDVEYFFQKWSPR